MNKTSVSGILLTMLVLAGSALGQKDSDIDHEPTSILYFLVVKDDNGKPVRNAAVIMHEMCIRDSLYPPLKDGVLRSTG